MTESRKFKKIALMSELLKLQEAEFNELDKKYFSEFKKDFQSELEFLYAAPSNIEKKRDARFKPDISRESFKKIHRALAKITHPDLNPDRNSNAEFIKIQQAYEQGNVSAMIDYAVQNELDIDLTEKDFAGLKRQIKIREKILENKKSTVRWVWCRSDKSVTMRNEIRQSLGINLKRFRMWIKDNCKSNNGK
jgi:hypothetical protein